MKAVVHAQEWVRWDAEQFIPDLLQNYELCQVVQP